MSRPRVLACRLDNVGDVLLTGPAVRALAAHADVTVLAGPSGAEAARMLPGVSDVLTYRAPWVPLDAGAFGESERAELAHLVRELEALRFDEAVVFTSFHQSPLPLALVLRMAGVRRIGATCVDHPGALLDLRHPYLPELHEVEQHLALVQAFGYEPDPSDDGALRVETGPTALPLVLQGLGPYVVVHPGASVPARALPRRLVDEVVDALAGAGWSVVLTGGPGERQLVRGRLAGGPSAGAVVDATGLLSLRQLAAVLAGADAVVCGNTGPAHLAAAVGTPVVSVFAPVVPAHRWRPWKVDVRLLGDQEIRCAGCRARTCPFPGQPCVGGIRADEVVDAVRSLRASRQRRVA